MSQEFPGFVVDIAQIYPADHARCMQVAEVSDVRCIFRYFLLTEEVTMFLWLHWKFAHLKSVIVNSCTTVSYVHVSIHIPILTCMWALIKCSVLPRYTHSPFVISSCSGTAHWGSSPSQWNQTRIWPLISQLGQRRTLANSGTEWQRNS